MTTMATLKAMPRYISHKRVYALEISAIDLGPNPLLTFRSPEFAPMTVPVELFARYTPRPGDYYVVYEDGYASISPRKAFRDGYHPEPADGQPDVHVMLHPVTVLLGVTAFALIMITFGIILRTYW